MDNRVTYDREDGGTITIDLILSFEINELNKKYIVYTLNDNGLDEDVDVFISELENNKIKSIPNNEVEMVLEYYENAKSLVV